MMGFVSSLSGACTPHKIFVLAKAFDLIEGYPRIS